MEWNGIYSVVMVWYGIGYSVAYGGDKAEVAGKGVVVGEEMKRGEKMV
jgi:hypothetical protein